MTGREGTYPPSRVVPYDPAWPQQYAALEESLRAGLGAGWLFEHTGSTSVPGLLGKPVIDVAIACPEGLTSTDARERLTGLGWVGWVAVNDHWAMFLLDDAGVRTAIAHVYTMDQWDTADLRVFPAWLRAHPEDRDAYAQIKRTLVDSGVWGLAYTAAKAPFVQEVTDRAHAAQRHIESGEQGGTTSL